MLYDRISDPIGFVSLEYFARRHRLSVTIIFGDALIEIGLETFGCCDIKAHIVGRRSLRACVCIGPHPKGDRVLLAIHAFLCAIEKTNVKMHL